MSKLKNMATKTDIYVGEKVRSTIKRKMVTNGFVIQGLKDRGIEMSDTKFSNKIYGMRDTFQPNEVSAMAEILDTDFSE